MAASCSERNDDADPCHGRVEILRSRDNNSQHYTAGEAVYSCRAITLDGGIPRSMATGIPVTFRIIVAVADFRLVNSNFGVDIANCNFRFIVSNFKLDYTNYRLLVTDYGFNIANF